MRIDRLVVHETDARRAQLLADRLPAAVERALARGAAADPREIERLVAGAVREARG